MNTSVVLWTHVPAKVYPEWIQTLHGTIPPVRTVCTIRWYYYVLDGVDTRSETVPTPILHGYGHSIPGTTTLHSMSWIQAWFIRWYVESSVVVGPCEMRGTRPPQDGYLVIPWNRLLWPNIDKYHDTRCLALTTRYTSNEWYLPDLTTNTMVWLVHRYLFHNTIEPW